MKETFTFDEIKKIIDDLVEFIKDFTNNLTRFIEGFKSGNAFSKDEE